MRDIQSIINLDEYFTYIQKNGFLKDDIYMKQLEETNSGSGLNTGDSMATPAGHPAKGISLLERSAE